MFVPGVNGSIIPSAPSGSKLKGAYKNSKKRKMPNGGIELALDAASYIPPPVGTVASLLGAGLNAYQGDYTGMSLDLASAASGGASKWFGAAADAAKMANSARLASSMASKAKTFQTFSNPVISKTASTVRDFSSATQNSPYNSTIRTPQRDNAQVQFRPNPNLRRMEEGGEVEGDDKEMVDGVAAILRGVKSKSNRLQLANKLAKQFNREKVNYDLSSFLKKSKVKK
jgi:hypothetical protein